MPSTPHPDIGVIAPVNESAAWQAADVIIAYLRQLGTEFIFGVPGGAIEPLYNALARSEREGGPRSIVARHECGAAHMADGYWRETGKLGVCCATTGPGATNLITGVACAYQNETPMLVLTAQTALPTFGKGAFQESSCTGIDTVGMFRYCTRYSSLVSHVEQLEHKLVTAIMIATGLPRGPVHLSIPVDVLRSPWTKAPAFDVKILSQRRHVSDDAAIRELWYQIKAAKKIVLLLGAGSSEAMDTLLEFAAQAQIAVITTPDAKGWVNSYHPLYKGVFGFAGHRSAYAAVADPSVDTVLAVGVRFSEWISGGWDQVLMNERLIHIDACADHFTGSPMARLHVQGRIANVFDRLLHLHRVKLRGGGLALASPAKLPAVDYKNARAHAATEAVLGVTLDEEDKCHSAAIPLKPQRLMWHLGQLFPPHTRWFADVGNSTAWLTHYLHPRERRSTARVTGKGTSHVIMDFGPMGWAIGAAVGAALGSRGGPVVCITGDGSFLMNGQEITVAAGARLTIIYIVLNDSALGMVKHGQRLAGAERIGFELPYIDFRALGKAMGIEAYSIRSPRDLLSLDIDALCARNGPALLDVYIDAEEVPPIGARMRVLTSS